MTRIVTRAMKAAATAKAWKNRYPNRDLKIYRGLVRLGKTPDPDDVDRIIGNNSWTLEESCDQCGIPSELLIECGEELNYTSSTCMLCISCLKKNLTAAEEHIKKAKL